jgi:N-acyl-D-amino-acid deacylase
VTYEILIKSGTVIDGTGAPARRANVEIANGKIARASTLSGTVRRTINAEGLVVAPGFIDPHTHYDALSRR